MLKLASKTICLSLISSFTAVEAYQKHQKDGFFVEAGFEAGYYKAHKPKNKP